MRTYLGFFFGGFLLCACSGKVIDVGATGPANDGGSTSTPIVPAAGPTAIALGWPDIGCQSGAQLPIVGVWEGYIEAFDFGTDRVKLEISHANASTACGKFTIGEAAFSPPTSSDPDVGPVPDASTLGVDPLPSLGFFDGFSMTLLKSEVTGPRLAFRASAAEVYKPWCELQVPYPVGQNGHSCIPTTSWSGVPGTCTLDFPSGATQTVDCGKAMLCSKVCVCLASGCSASADWSFGVDLRFAGDEATGTITVAGMHTLHLARVP